MRFPELESLVPTPLEYIRTVQVYGDFCVVYFVGSGKVLPVTFPRFIV